uniref:Uncharacterized protein n=1 Tax=Aquila chrysaetos chrysaetos TaxID=223781 RepID=A0A663FFW2_AQUCH
MAAAMAAMAAAVREWAAAAARQDAAWRAAMAAWAPLLVSLAGLAAQMRAAQRLAWGGSPLGPFGDLRERLWRKQRGAAEALLEQLGGRRCGPCGTPWGPAWPPCCGCTRSGRRSWAWRRPCGAGRAAPRWLTRWRGCRTWRRYLESKLLLLRIRCDSLADVEALPQSWERILARYKEDVVQGSSAYSRPKGPFPELRADVSALGTACGPGGACCVGLSSSG